MHRRVQPPKSANYPDLQIGSRSPLSNREEKINLGPDSRAGNRAGRGSHQGSLSALAAIRRQSHIPIAAPANGSDRARRSGKRCWVLCGGCHKPVAKQV